MREDHGRGPGREDDPVEGHVEGRTTAEPDAAVDGTAAAETAEPGADVPPTGASPDGPGEPTAADTAADAPPEDDAADVPPEDDADPADDAAPVASVSEPRPSRRRSVARGLGLTVSGLALVTAAAGAVVGAAAWPAGERQPVEAGVVDVPAGPVTAVCAGPPALTAGEGMSVDPELDPANVTPTTLTQLLTLPRGDAGAAQATYTPLDGEPQELARAGKVRALEVHDPGGGALLRAEPVGDVAALPAGATLTRTDAGDLRGLAAAPCQGPQSTTWLVGGGTDLGQSAQLVLTNTGDTPATVTATMWTTLGLADAARLAEIVVAPHSETTVLLEGVATGDPALALRVDATGGQVAARVQDHQLDGLVGAGVDVVTPAAPPALTVTVPGVVLTESGTDDPAASAVRLVNPGEETATASVTLLGPDGEVEVPGAEDVVLDPGAVLDLTLAGVDAGAYAVEITADRPVTGAVVLARVGKAGELDPDVPPVERAWTPAADPAATGVLLTPGLGEVVDAATLTLTNPGADDVETELVPVGDGGTLGDPVGVTVPGRSTVTADAAKLAEGTVAVQVRTEGGTGVLAASVLTAEAGDGELVSVLPLSPDPHAARSVRVEVR